MHNFDFALEDLILGFVDQLFALIQILIERIAGGILSGFLF
jgi:hypothetical protein